VPFRRLASGIDWIADPLASGGDTALGLVSDREIRFHQILGEAAGSENNDGQGRPSVAAAECWFRSQYSPFGENATCQTGSPK